MIQNDILKQVSLNESPNFISMQGIADWLYSKTSRARVDLNELLEGSDHADDYYQAGKFSLKVSDLREIFNDVDQDIDKTYNVLNITTGNMENVSGDEITDEISSMFQSNEIIAAGFEVLGTSSDDLSSMSSAFTDRVNCVCGTSGTKSEQFQLVQRTILDGNGSIKGKATNMTTLLETRSSGTNKVESDFADFTGSTPSAVWSNVVWPTITSCVSSIVSVVSTVLGGVFGLAGTAVLTLGKSIFNSYRIAMNPNLVNMFNTHSWKGSLNALNESIPMAKIEYKSGYTIGQLKGVLRDIFILLHRSRNFVLGGICCFTIPGLYILIGIDEWDSDTDFVGKIAISPKVGATTFFDFCAVNKYDDTGSILQTEASGYYDALIQFLAIDSSGPVDLASDATASKNQIASAVASSLSEGIFFMQAFAAKDYVTLDSAIEKVFSEHLKYKPLNSISNGYNLVGSVLRSTARYEWVYDEEDGWTRVDWENNPIISNITMSAFRAYDMGNPGYSNADILWLSRCLTPENCPYTQNEAQPHNGGNILTFYRGLYQYLYEADSAGSSEYYPHIWLSSNPIGYVGIRSDKTIAAIYYANLAAAVAITAATAIAITMAIATRGARKKAYVYRGYADNMSWNADPRDKKALKACWKANKRAMRWEKISGTYDDATGNVDAAVNATGTSLDISPDPAGVVTPGGTLYNVMSSVGLIQPATEQTVEDIGHVIHLIKGE